MQEKILETIETTTRTSKMNIQEAPSYLHHDHHHHQNPQSFYMMDNIMESYVSFSSTATSGLLSHTQNLVYNFSMLKEKIQQLQPLVSMAISQSPSDNLSNAGTLIQEVIVTASSMMYALQQLSLGPIVTQANTPDDEISGQVTSEIIINYNHDTNYKMEKMGSSQTGSGSGSTPSDATGPCDIIELHASELLAKYTHYCQVCGKGFKRDANLRMHMRAHGDEYKTNAALTNPTQKPESGSGSGLGKRKYSCPHEGCRWNRKHAKFQPLKSIICVKNHYKRSHCPKMYVCNRCNRKQFSVLSDLRTHEKHCGDLRWMCSCGTTFSRKDKLMGHVSLFDGHVPVERNSTEVLEMNGRQNTSLNTCEV